MVIELSILMIHIVNKELRIRSTSFNSNKILFVWISFTDSYFHNLRILVKSIFNIKILLSHSSDISRTSCLLFWFLLIIIADIDI